MTELNNKKFTIYMREDNIKMLKLQAIKENKSCSKIIEKLVIEYLYVIESKKTQEKEIINTTIYNKNNNIINENFI